MLIVSSVCYISFSVPAYAFSIAAQLQSVSSSEFVEMENAILVTFFLLMMNHSANFYLYLASSKLFRQRFIQIILCGRGPMVAPSAS